MITNELIDIYTLRQVGEVSEREVVECGELRLTNDDRVLPIARLPKTALKHDVDSAIKEFAGTMSLALPGSAEVALIAVFARCQQIRDGAISPVAGARSLAAIGRRFAEVREPVAVFLGILDDYDEGLLSDGDMGTHVVNHADLILARSSQ